VRGLLSTAILALSPIVLWAELPEIFGYFEPQYFGYMLDDHYYQMQTNKLRLDIMANLSQAAELGANINFINYNGAVRYNLLDYVPERIRFTVPAGWESSYIVTYSDTIYLDNAYARMTFKWWDITVGRQQISYGTGYAWNPTDIFNVKEILDPTYEQPGHNAIRIDVPLWGRLNCLGVYAPGDDFDASTMLFRLKASAAYVDFSLSAAMMKVDVIDTMGFASGVEHRKLLGADVVGEMLGLGVWAEVAHNLMEDSDDYEEGVVGLDYTLDSGTYILAEYYYNGRGRDHGDDYTLSDWMGYLSGTTRSLGQHQIYFYIDHPAMDVMNAGASVVYCITDESVVIVPQIMYSIFQDVELSVFGNLYIGGSGSTFNPDLGPGGLARLRVYF
jgi:hypothetical protein